MACSKDSFGFTKTAEILFFLSDSGFVKQIGESELARFSIFHRQSYLLLAPGFFAT